MNAIQRRPDEPPRDLYDDKPPFLDGLLSPAQERANEILQGPQRHTLGYGGSRSGKTFRILRAVVCRAIMAPGSRHIVLRRHKTSIEESIWQETLPTVVRICAPTLRHSMSKSDLTLYTNDGSAVVLGGLDDKDRVDKILGRECATLYFNECSELPYQSVAVARTRLAQKVITTYGNELPLRCYYDLNPTGTAHWSYLQFIKKVDPITEKPLAEPHQYAYFKLHPRDNAQNLAAGYIESELESLPERKKKRFLDGEYSPDIEGALWTIEMLAGARCDPSACPPLQRVVVAVDPSGASGAENERSDDIGIVVAGKGTDGRAYVLGDFTIKDGPTGWGRQAVMTYAEFRADCVVGEKNFGGAMVQFVIQTAATELKITVPYKNVVASRGKVVRAEPCSVLYSRDLVRHVGTFSKLEDEMTNMSTSGYQGSKSPNRCDALVWALTELMLDESEYSFGSV